MATIDERIKILPAHARQEVFDFIDFIIDRYSRGNVSEEKEYWNKLGEKSVDKIWDNEEDDIYNELYKG